MKTRYFKFVAVLAMLVLSSTVYAQYGGFGDNVSESGDPVTIAIEPGVTAIGPDDTFSVIVRLTIDEHYHIYWKAPGDTGVPTTIKWSLPPGFEVKKTSWPVPHMYTTDLGPDTPPMYSFGYENELALVQTIKAPADLKPGGKVTLKADLEWLSCREGCLPGSGSANATITLAEKTVIHPRLDRESKKLLTQTSMTSEVWSVETAISGDILTVTPKGGGVAAIESLVFMPFDNVATVNLGAGQVWKGGVLTITLQKDRKGDTPSGILVRKKPWAEGGSTALRVFLGDGSSKSIIETPASKPRTDTPAQAGGLVDAGHGFVLLDAEVDKLPFNFTVIGQSKEGNGVMTILKYVLFAFLGGLILNVMPCVLPVLSIKAMSIVNSAHKDRTQIFKGSMAYTAGIMTSFLVLATLVAIAKSAGQQAGWGDQMQSPIFVIVLFVVIWIFSLSLFDMFIIQLPGMQAANKASGKGGHLGSFLSGIFAVLLSTPCTAPLLGSAVGFLFAQSIPIVFVSFMAIGLGLALPFILLGVTPSAIKWIPKPGAWMNVFREVMGFLLIGTAVFLAYILKSQLGEHFFSFLVFIVPLTFACWLYGKAAGPGVETKRHLLILAIVVGIIGFSGYKLITIPEVTHANGNQTAELMRKTLIDDKRMVFLDFGADWCATCKLFENTVLYSKPVQDEFKKKNVLLIKGDFTSRDPKINAWLERFGRAGVPLYVILRPGDSIVADMLPDAVTRQMVIDALNK